MPSGPSRLGLLCVVSGPSGSGKTTLCRKAAEREGCRYSISCTTRKAREGEIDGEHYHFLSRTEFEERALKGDFLEHAEVHGNLYGTLRSSIEELVQAGTDVVMDIDVQGAALVRSSDDALIQRCLVDVFILPPSMEELRSRLSGRGTDSDEVVELRMKNSLEEMREWQEYRYTITSGSMEEDWEAFQHLLEAERRRSSRLKPNLELGAKISGPDSGEDRHPELPLS